MIKLSCLPTTARGQGGVWPTPGQEQLLRAGLLDDPAAPQAWRRWQEMEPSGALDPASWKLLPLVYFNLTRLGVRDALLDEARLVFRFYWARNQMLFHRAGGFLGELQRLEIPVVILKGAALAQLYYPDPGARPMEDLDLLVPMDQFSRLGRHLVQQGWHEGKNYDFIYFNPDALPSFEFVRSDGFSVDLHGQVLHRDCRKGAEAPFWNGAQPWVFQGHTVLTLCPEDHFFHAVSHGVRWNVVPPCRWMADVWWILRRAGKSFRWERVIERARFHRYAPWVLQGLERMGKIVPFELPEGVLPELAATPLTVGRRVEFAFDLLPERVSLWGRARCIWDELEKYEANASWTRKMANLRSYLLEAWSVPTIFQLPLAGVIMLAKYVWNKFKLLAETRPGMKFAVTPLRAVVLFWRERR